MTSAKFDVQLTPSAKQDLSTLYDYTALTRSEGDAARLVDALSSKIGSLESFPMRGNVPKELEGLGIDGFRQTVLVPYRMIYTVVGNIVVIILVADGRRDMKSLLQQRLLTR